MATTVTATKREALRRNEEKWTPVLMGAGWTVIPSVILERQQAIGLDATDVNIILHLVRHWWYSDRPPYPSKRAIAECMGVSLSTVRRRIAAMESGGIVKRVPRFDRARGQRNNAYDLSGLIKMATPFAQEAINERKKRHQDDGERRLRKKTVLRVVK